MSCDLNSTDIDNEIGSLFAFAEKIYDDRFKPIIEDEYKQNSISKEERARLRLEYMAVSIQAIPTLYPTIIDSLSKKNLLPKQCEKIEAEIALTKQQKQVALSQGKLYAQQRKSFINRDTLNIIDEYMKGWVTALSEGVTDAGAYPIIASELRTKIDATYNELLKEVDNETNCQTRCVSITEVS